MQGKITYGINLLRKKEVKLNKYIKNKIAGPIPNPTD